MARLLCPRDFPGKNTGVGCHAPLQGIFLTQESNPWLLHLLHWQAKMELVNKWLAFQSRKCKRCGFGPWMGKIPWEGEWQPTPMVLPEKSHGQRSLAGYSPWAWLSMNALRLLLQKSRTRGLVQGFSDEVCFDQYLLGVCSRSICTLHSYFKSCLLIIPFFELCSSMTINFVHPASAIENLETHTSFVLIYSSLFEVEID